MAEMQRFQGHENFDFSAALIQPLALARAEDPDIDKTIFLVLYDLPQNALSLRQIARGLNWDASESLGCRFYFLDIGDRKPELEDLCGQYRRSEYHLFPGGTGIGDFIQEKCSA